MSHESCRTPHHTSVRTAHGRHARGLKDIHTLKDKQNDSGQDMAHYNIPQPPPPPAAAAAAAATAAAAAGYKALRFSGHK